VLDDIDISVEDREGRPVLVAKVSHTETSAEEQHGLLDVLDSSCPSVPFALLADPATLRIYRRDRGPFEEVATLDAAEVIGHYSPGYTRAKADNGFKPIFRTVLVGFVASWLSDLSRRWKAGEPPGRDELARIGLLGRIEGGEVTNEELMGDLTLS